MSMKKVILSIYFALGSTLVLGNAKEGTHELPGYPKIVNVKVPLSKETLSSKFEPGTRPPGHHGPFDPLPPATIYWITWRPFIETPLTVVKNYFSARIGGNDFSSDLLKQAEEQDGVLSATLTIALKETNVTRSIQKDGTDQKVCERYLRQFIRLGLDDTPLKRMDGSSIEAIALGSEEGECSK